MTTDYWTCIHLLNRIQWKETQLSKDGEHPPTVFAFQLPLHLQQNHNFQRRQRLHAQHGFCHWSIRCHQGTGSFQYSFPAHVSCSFPRYLHGSHYTLAVGVRNWPVRCLELPSSAPHPNISHIMRHWWMSIARSWAYRNYWTFTLWTFKLKPNHDNPCLVLCQEEHSLTHC